MSTEIIRMSASLYDIIDEYEDDRDFDYDEQQSLYHYDYDDYGDYYNSYDLEYT